MILAQPGAEDHSGSADTQPIADPSVESRQRNTVLRHDPLFRMPVPTGGFAEFEVFSFHSPPPIEKAHPLPAGDCRQKKMGELLATFLKSCARACDEESQVG